MDLLELFKESKIYNKNHPKFLEHLFNVLKALILGALNQMIIIYLNIYLVIIGKEKRKRNMSSKEKKNIETKNI